MAHIVDHFRFVDTSKDKYPWDDWFDGRIWCLVRGVDFDTECRLFRSAITSKAKARRVKVRTSVKTDLNRVYVQAYTTLDPMVPEVPVPTGGVPVETTSDFIEVSSAGAEPVYLEVATGRRLTLAEFLDVHARNRKAGGTA